jgi:hypothetical protein
MEKRLYQSQYFLQALFLRMSLQVFTATIKSALLVFAALCLMTAFFMGTINRFMSTIFDGQLNRPKFACQETSPKPELAFYKISFLNVYPNLKN